MIIAIADMTSPHLWVLPEVEYAQRFFYMGHYISTAFQAPVKLHQPLSITKKKHLIPTSSLTSSPSWLLPEMEHAQRFFYNEKYISTAFHKSTKTHLIINKAPMYHIQKNNDVSFQNNEEISIFPLDVKITTPKKNNGDIPVTLKIKTIINLTLKTELNKTKLLDVDENENGITTCLFKTKLEKPILIDENKKNNESATILLEALSEACVKKNENKNGLAPITLKSKVDKSISINKNNCKNTPAPVSQKAKLNTPIPIKKDKPKNTSSLNQSRTELGPPLSINIVKFEKTVVMDNNKIPMLFNGEKCGDLTFSELFCDKAEELSFAKPSSSVESVLDLMTAFANALCKLFPNDEPCLSLLNTMKPQDYVYLLVEMHSLRSKVNDILSKQISSQNINKYLGFKDSGVTNSEETSILKLVNYSLSKSSNSK